ncbi:hypothetical protein EV143_12012 [Flavobacterium chryseum]|uniref:hypothetical protein n=1 Tax=Flavobacterium sp. P3160 TaxID=2512113 RepID=UPI00105E3A4C|nr:hypothetical protein [Flavobacterium sp. P3160]TDO68750.1 hypothetical protein EV143_12012 [Flavobacterium sp. P3160]
MSLLTGKCEIAFNKYIQDQMYYLGTEKLGVLFLSALYIEFFDSVQIYIQDWGFVDYVEGMKPGFDSSVVYKSENHSVSDGFFDNRQSAITAALEKANEIYNQNH